MDPFRAEITITNRSLGFCEIASNVEYQSLEFIIVCFIFGLWAVRAFEKLSEFSDSTLKVTLALVWRAKLLIDISHPLKCGSNSAKGGTITSMLLMLWSVCFKLTT